MSTTAAIDSRPSPDNLPRTHDSRVSSRLASEAYERDQLTDRLRRLRRVLPVLAQEMAAARRQVTRLKLDNRQLTEQVRELRAQLQARERRAR